MDELRSRFASLDSVPTPELWSEVERRAAAPTRNGAVARLAGRRTVLRGAPLAAPLGSQHGLGLSWMVALAVLLVTTIAVGGLATGAWRIEDLRLPLLPTDATPAPSPTSAPSPTPPASSQPTILGCAPVAAETFRADYPVVIEDETGLVTACRLGRGWPTASSFTEQDIEISNAVSSSRHLRALWWIHGCDSDATVSFTRGPRAYTLSVDARQAGECVPGGSTFVTVDLELARSVAANEVMPSIIRTRRTPGESFAPVPVPTESGGSFGAIPRCAGFTDAADPTDRPPSDDDAVTWISVRPFEDDTVLHPGAIAAIAYDAPEWPLTIIRLDPSTGAACRLIGLPADRAVTALDWSPRGDALAISAVDRSTGTGELLVWSAAGISRVWTGPEAPRVSWSPGADMIAVATSASAAIVSAWGSPVLELGESGERPLWSPDNSRLALWDPAGHSASPAGRIVIVTAADGLSTMLEPEGSVAMPIAWLDAETLLGYNQASATLHAIPIDDPISARPWPGREPQVSMPQLGGTLVFSPDFSLAASTLPGMDEATDIVVADARTGGASPVARVSEVAGGGTIAVQGLAWAPDSHSIAYSLVDSTSGTMLGVWVVDSDGRNTRRLTDRPFALVDQRDNGDGADGGSWQPSWQQGETEP